MTPKYVKQQKVKIVQVDESIYKLYPYLKKYMNESGTVLESYLLTDGYEDLDIITRKSYVYCVRVDKDKSEIPVPEEALKPENS